MNTRKTYVNEGISQFTLREMQRFATNRKFWAVIVVATVILGVSGPFKTLTELETVPRFAYWAAITVVTFFVNLAAILPIIKRIRGGGLSDNVVYLLAAIAGSFPVTLVVWFINAFLSGISEPTGAELMGLWPKCAPIAIAITMSYSIFRHDDLPKTAQPSASPDPPFLKRLSITMGKDIVSLQAQDHYVQVTTERGRELILLRLEDAISELADIDGLRVHRSWWVARRAVDRLDRSDGKLAIILKSGQAVPVSRTYAKQVRARFS